MIVTVNPEIAQLVEAIRVVDTHEHLEEEATRLARSNDFTTLFHQYAGDDLRVAGMSEADHTRCFAPETPLDEKWALFEPWYRAARNTAYIKAVEIALHELYGVEELTADSVHVLSDRMAERNRPGIYEWILREQAGIDHAQVNALEQTFYRTETDRSLLRQDLSVVYLLYWPLPFDELASETDITIASFGEFGRAIDTLFERRGPQACAIKQQSAYQRPQYFADVPDADAERIFERVLSDTDSVGAADRKTLGDWTFHRCIRRAIDHHLPIKIHTGYKAGANYMDMRDIRVRDLNNLFIQYPEATFNLFHIGYPDQNEMVALAKHFTNVYVDLCWAWIIDPIATRGFVKQFLTAAPANKLFGFGGDYIVAEPIVGHLKIARQQIARVLSELVAEEYFTVAEAGDLARRMLRENALTVFGPLDASGV